MSISNTVSTLPGILAPILAGVLTKNVSQVNSEVIIYLAMY